MQHKYSAEAAQFNFCVPSLLSVLPCVPLRGCCGNVVGHRGADGISPWSNNAAFVVAAAYRAKRMALVANLTSHPHSVAARAWPPCRAPPSYEASLN